MNIGKRALVLMLSVLMTFSTLPVSVFAGDEAAPAEAPKQVEAQEPVKETKPEPKPEAPAEPKEEAAPETPAAEPAAETPATEATDPAAEKQTGEEAPKAEEAAPTETEETPEKEEVKYPAQTLKVTASDGAVITVKAPEGAFPEGSKVKAKPVSEEAVLALLDGAAEAAAYDITVHDADGNEVQPKRDVKVSMANTGLEKADAVYYVNDAMTKATLVTENIDNPSDAFTTDHFTIYVIEYLTEDNNKAYDGTPYGTGSRSGWNVENGDITLHVDETFMLTNYESGVSQSAFNSDVLSDWNSSWKIWDNTARVSSGNGLSYTTGGFYDHSSGQVKPYLKLTVLDKPQYGDCYTIQFYSGQYSSGTTPTVRIYVRYQYDVTFNMNGHGESIDKQTVDEGTKATKPTDPTAEGYIFKGWYTNQGCTDGYEFDFDTPITGDTPLYAKWAETKKVTFKDYDGSVISEKDYEVGTPATSVEKPADPTRAETDDYVYTFAGWTPEIAAVTDDATYTATYTATPKHTVTFINYDDSTIQTGKYAEGTAISSIAPANPEKPQSERYTYSFNGWATEQGQTSGQQASELGNVTGDATYFAAFKQNDRLYRARFFIDYDNGSSTSFGEDVYVKYGERPVQTAIPSIDATAQYTYTFVGWNNYYKTELYTDELPPIYENTSFIAKFNRTVNKYKIKFVDEDGSEILAEKEYEYGTTAANIVKPDDPTKPDDETHRYTFDGWDPQIKTVTKDQTYTATYSSKNLYKISFVDEDGTTVLEETKYPEGTLAANIEKPADPTKEPTTDYTYEFDGWDPEIADVTANATYKAKYKELENYNLDVERIHAWDASQNSADVQEASNKTTVGTTGWVASQSDVDALKAYFAGDHSSSPTMFRDYFQAGETYYSVAMVKFKEGETPDAKRVKINENEFVKAAGTPVVNESENELVVPFSVTIPGITVTVEFGSKHAALASQAAENAPEGVVMSASGGTLTYKAEKGSDRWYDVTGPLRDVLSDISNKDNGEQMFRGFVSYNLHPIDYYADAEACYAEMETAMDSVPQNENMKLYILWTKPTGAEVTIAKPVCGTEVAIDQESSKQIGAPEVSVTGGNVSVYDEISPMWIDTEADRPQPYEGTIKGGETYKAMAVLLPDFGYYLDPDKVTVKGGTLEEGMGMGDEMITIAVEADHDWGEWQMTKKPTATEFGVETRVCKHCDKEQTRQIAKIPEYTITYDLNGGTLDGEKGKVTFKVEAGTEITLPEPTRKGYEFDYWKGSKYEAGDTYTVNGNHTFTAQWIAETTDSKKSKGVDTGDAAGLVVWLLLGIAAEAGAVYMYRRRREY